MRPKFNVKPIDIEVQRLRLHPALNREVSPARVRELYNDMNLDSLGRFAVWRDGSSLYVIDGQHRKLALEEHGLGDLKVRADEYRGMTFEDACEQFLNLNKGLVVRPFDKFDKGWKAGRMAETETKRIIEEAGLTPAAVVGDGRLVAVGAALDVWKLDQGEALATALRVATSAWGTTPDAVEGQIIRGLGLVAHRYNGELDYDVLIKKLAKSGRPATIIGKARAQREFEGGSIGRNVAQIVVALYNKGLRSRQVAPL